MSADLDITSLKKKDVSSEQPSHSPLHIQSLRKGFLTTRWKTSSDTFPTA